MNTAHRLITEAAMRLAGEMPAATEYAFTINMELGVLVTGGKLPAHVQEHFDQLIEVGVLAEP